MLGRYGLLSILVCASLTTSQAAEIRLQVDDAVTGKSVPCRIHLKDTAGEPVLPRGFPSWHDHFVCDGMASLDLPAGEYSYEVDRGPEYYLETGKLRVVEASEQQLTIQLRRLVNLAEQGWWSGELHVHRPVADIELLMRAEDLHVTPLITWWNYRNWWAEHALPPQPLIQFDRDRFYHLMGGEDERNGGALLFFNLNRPLKINRAQAEFPSPMKFVAEAREQADVWIDLEKPFWYDAPIWLASDQVDSIGIAHNHMQRGGVLADEAWGKPRDLQRYPAPQGNGFWTQEIYYHILNCGLRLPPSAGSASGVLPNPVGYDRMYVELDGELTYEKWWAGFKAGHVFVTNGPLLRCRANGQLPGTVFKALAGQSLEIDVTAELESRDPISAIEIIQDGRVVRTISYALWKQSSSLGKFQFDQSGWFLIRAIADVPTTFRFASTGPFYVEVGSATTRVSRESAQFFLDWVRQREGKLKLDDPGQREEVLLHHRAAEQFWKKKVESAND